MVSSYRAGVANLIPLYTHHILIQLYPLILMLIVRTNMLDAYLSAGSMWYSSSGV